MLQRRFDDAARRRFDDALTAMLVCASLSAVVFESCGIAGDEDEKHGGGGDGVMGCSLAHSAGTVLGYSVEHSTGGTVLGHSTAAVLVFS